MQEEVTKNFVSITSDTGDILLIPRGEWGQPLNLNGNVIPSARVWATIADYAIQGVAPSRSAIMEEAKRAEIYRLLEQGILVRTDTPREKDKELVPGIYLRMDRQRVRPLLSEFSLAIAKIEAEYSTDNVLAMHAYCKSIGLSPVAAADGRIMYSKDPQAVFNAFGTKDWTRLMVYIRRPGSSSVSLDLTGL